MSTAPISDESRRLYAKHSRTRAAEAEQRDLVKQQAAADLRAGWTVGQIVDAGCSLSRETLRQIARETGVERLREPTVRAIRDAE